MFIRVSAEVHAAIHEEATARGVTLGEVVESAMMGRVFATHRKP